MMNHRRSASLLLLLWVLSANLCATAAAATPPGESQTYRSLLNQRRLPTRAGFRRLAPRQSPVVTPRTRLPRGRNYYQGRYFGNYNNRYYGPQYGYF